MASSADLVKASTEGTIRIMTRSKSPSANKSDVAAEKFVESYYTALARARSTLATFYVVPSTPESVKPTIVLNGNAVPDGTAVQEIFDKQMPPARYEAQSIDCQVINPLYTPADTPLNTTSVKSHISILVMVSGWVRYSEDRNDPQRGFSETFVLVPNPQAENQKGGRKVKDFLIQTQNFRLVV